MIATGVFIWSSDDSPESITEAKGWVDARGYTQDDVKIVRVSGEHVSVVAKRPL